MVRIREVGGSGSSSNSNNGATRKRRNVSKKVKVEQDNDSEYEDITEEMEEEEGEEIIENETLWNRLAALKYMFPSWMQFRVGRFSQKMMNQMWSVSLLAGRLAWIFTTSMLLVGLPVLFAYDREKNLHDQQLLSLPSSMSGSQ